MVKAATAERHGKALDVMASDVGVRIRKARQERGLTLAKVGGDDLSRSFLSSVESGRSRISLRALALVSQRLDLPMSYFLDGSAESSEIAKEWLLNQAEAVLSQGEPDAAIRYLDEIPADGEYQSRIAWLRARALFHLGQVREAGTLLQETLPQMRQEADSHFALEYELTLGAVLYSSGNTDEALLHLRRALEGGLETQADPVLMGRITVTIGHVYFVRGEIEAAINQYQRALEWFGKVRDFYTQGCIYSGLSRAYKQQDNMKSALHYAKLSAATFKATNNLREVAHEINSVAMRYQEMDDLKEALAFAQEAVDRAREIHAPDVEALAHTTLAEIHLKQNDLNAAETEARAAEALDGKDSGEVRVAVWKALADVARQRGDHGRAEELYVSVMQALRQTPANRLYARTALAYGEMLREQGQTERALDLAFEVARAQLNQRK